MLEKIEMNEILFGVVSALLRLLFNGEFFDCREGKIRFAKAWEHLKKFPTFIK